MEGCEDLIGDFALDGDQIERCNADGSAGADALRTNVEQLPVQVESIFRTEKIAGENEGDQQLAPDGERVHLRDGKAHERAGARGEVAADREHPRATHRDGLGGRPDRLVGVDVHLAAAPDRVRLRRGHRDLVDGANVGSFMDTGAIVNPMNMERASMRGTDLRNADLTEANLTGADMTGAQASGIEFFRCEMAGVNFEKANLRNVNFRLANIRGAKFAGADMGVTILRETDLDGVDLSGVDLSTTLMPKDYVAKK